MSKDNMSSDLKEDILFNTPLEEALIDLEASLASVDDSKAHRLARKAIGADDSINLDEKYLLFTIGEHTIAITLKAVVEVAEMPKITRIPNVPFWIRGIVSVHDEILSVIDLGAYMGWVTKKTAPADRMVIIKLNDIKVVVDVERIHGTHVMQARESTSADSLLPAFDPRYFYKGTTSQGTQCVVLDHIALMSEERFSQRKM